MWEEESRPRLPLRGTTCVFVLAVRALTVRQSVVPATGVGRSSIDAWAPPAGVHALGAACNKQSSLLGRTRCEDAQGCAYTLYAGLLRSW
jgi:hypothetical protein